jgi:hypothetical protein
MILEPVLACGKKGFSDSLSDYKVVYVYIRALA